MRRRTRPKGLDKPIDPDTFLPRRCLRKVRHVTRNAARDHARSMAKLTGEPFEHYRCPDGCGGFHVGHSRQWIAGRQRERRLKRRRSA